MARPTPRERPTCRSGCCAVRGHRSARAHRGAWIDCPFTGERLAAVRALRPDVGIIHAQRADRAGNVQLWGISGVQKETVLASSRSLVTVEQVVDELEPVPGAVIIPAWVVTAVAVAPDGAHPSYAHGYYERDNGFYRGGMRSAATARASASGCRARAGGGGGEMSDATPPRR